MSGVRAKAIARTLLCALACAFAASIARGEDLVPVLSRDHIPIRSNFAGETLGVIGVIEGAPANLRPQPQTPVAPRGAGAAPSSPYDVVVTVRGPRGAVTVRRKQQWGPFWLNLDNRKYIAIPSFIAVLSNRELEKIANPAQREEWRLGVANLIPQQTAARGANDPDFRNALERIRSEQGLFFDDPEAVTFMTPTVFRATIQLPGDAPIGAYAVDVALLRDGALITRKQLAFTVSKTDVEQTVADTARERPFLYAMALTLLSLGIGWIASMIFRRD